jgi:hypothetical protein
MAALTGAGPVECSTGVWRCIYIFELRIAMVIRSPDFYTGTPASPTDSNYYSYT